MSQYNKKMKKEIKVYLEPEEIKELQRLAGAINIEGRGWLSNYLRVICKQDLVIMNENLKKVLRNIQLK